MKIGYEIDKVKLYNFMQRSGINYGELSSMLGKSKAYISQVMCGRINVSDEILEKLADLMETTCEDLIAKPNAPYENANPGRRKRSVIEVEKEADEESETRPTFEQRMEEMIMTDEERRRKFFSSQAFIDEMKKYTGDNTQCIKKEEDVIVNPSDTIESKIEALTNFLSRAIVNGRKYIGTMDLINILLGQA